MSQAPADQSSAVGTAVPATIGTTAARDDAPPAGAAAAGANWARLRRALETFAPLLALVLLSTIIAIVNPVFLKPSNLFNVLQQWSFVGIIAVGMTFVIISGGIDLSVGSLVAFAGGLGIWVMNTAIGATTRTGADGLPFTGAQRWLAGVFGSLHLGSEATGVALALLVTLAAATIAGVLNGLLVSKGRLAPFIATLGGMAAYRSLALSMADGGEFRSASDHLFKQFGTGGIPIPGMYVRGTLPLVLPYPVIVFLLVAVVGHVLLRWTRYGRYVYAIGCNERAAVYSAVNVDRVKILTYTLLGAACGVSAALLASRLNSVSSSSTGNLNELDAIAAVVIGGTRMQGGSGGVWGTVVGVLILAVVANMLSLMNVSPYLQGLVKGLIIIAAVLVQRRGKTT